MFDELKFIMNTSLPMRERGLKHLPYEYIRNHRNVAPHAGAWIETVGFDDGTNSYCSRSPCGSVD